jgi:hypothetical protein
MSPPSAGALPPPGRSFSCAGNDAGNIAGSTKAASAIDMIRLRIEGFEKPILKFILSREHVQNQRFENRVNQRPDNRD